MKFLAVCATCKLQKFCDSTCPVCERAGLDRPFCSPRCKHVHRRDGRHRLEAAKVAAVDAQATPLKKKARWLRAEVKIVRREPGAAARKPRQAPSRRSPT